MLIVAELSIPNIRAYMGRLLLEIVSSTKIYRLVYYKQLIIRFLFRLSHSDKSESVIGFIKKYIAMKSPRKNIVFRGLLTLLANPVLIGICVGYSVCVSSIDGLNVYLDAFVVQYSPDGFPDR